MHLHLPIEQLVQRVGTAFQFGFATEAKELLPEGEEFLLNASHRGLHVLARNEEALALPRGRPVSLVRGLCRGGQRLAVPVISCRRASSCGPMRRSSSRCTSASFCRTRSPFELSLR
jgi:hypothetical protein